MQGLVEFLLCHLKIGLAKVLSASQSHELLTQPHFGWDFKFNSKQLQ